MAQPTLNIYQLQKAVKPIIADVQRLFTAPEVRAHMAFLAATAVENAKGIPISIRIDVKSPTDSRISNSITIMITPSLRDPARREAILIRERGSAAKAMKYRGNLSVNRKAAGMQDWNDQPNGDMSNVPAEILAESEQGGGE